MQKPPITLRQVLDPVPGATRFVFVSGKGGVGKTTVAAAIATRLADEGLRTLIVSTDIQRSLDDVFDQEIGFTETPIGAVANLEAVNVDPEQSTRKHRAKIIATLEVLDPDSVILAQMKADVRTDCGAAQASVFEMNHYLAGTEYDAIVFDTAPTGIHLEKILSQSNFVRMLAEQGEARRRYSQVPGADRDALAEFDAIVESDARALRTLASGQTSFVLVMIPEAMPLAEVERSVPMLEAFGIEVRGIVVNQVLDTSERSASPFWEARGQMQDEYADRVAAIFPLKALATSFLVPEVEGIERLRRIGRRLLDGGEIARPAVATTARVA